MPHSIRDKAKHAFGGYFLELNATLAAAWPRERRPATSHFVFFGRGRSGSTLLVDMLDRHPDVTCLGEILRYRTLAPKRYIENRLDVCVTKARGFKLLSYQVRWLSTEGQTAIREWMEHRRAAVFHLRRDNLLRHAISNIYAAKRRAYHSTDKRSETHQAIEIAPEELIAWMDGSQSLLDFELAFLEGLDRFEIVYERDLSDFALQQRTYAEIVERLGLPQHPSSTSLKKVTPPDLRALIANFSEIERALAATSHKHYLQCLLSS